MYWVEGGPEGFPLAIMIQMRYVYMVGVPEAHLSAAIALPWVQVYI